MGAPRAPAPSAVVRPVSGLARAPWAWTPLRPPRAVVRPVSASRRGKEPCARASTTARARVHAVAMGCQRDPPHSDARRIRLTTARPPAYVRARSDRDRRHAGNTRQRLDIGAPAGLCACACACATPGEGPAARESPPRSAPASQDLYASQSRRVSPLGALSPRPAPRVGHELEQQSFGHA